MKISKKAEYALRALAILASKPPSCPIQITQLAETGQIPVKFLEQILLILKKSGLLKSKRGIGGGYQLQRAAAEITLAEIIRTIDGPLRAFQVDADAQQTPGYRGLQACLDELSDQTEAFLEAETIASLLLREDPDGIMAFDI